jgi:hypothetical protein
MGSTMTVRRLLFRTGTLVLGGAVIAGIVAAALLGIVGGLLPRNRKTDPE